MCTYHDIVNYSVFLIVNESLLINYTPTFVFVKQIFIKTQNMQKPKFSYCVVRKLTIKCFFIIPDLKFLRRLTYY